MVQQKHLLHSQAESAQCAQKARINSIGRQLVADFHPAVKNVASASQNLLRAFQNLSRHFYAYTAALYAFGYSSNNSEECEVREQSKRLQTATEVLKGIHSEQFGWMEHFTAMTQTINHNCKTEKERLKGLIGSFSERERELTKAIDKGKQMPGIMNSFYETELEAMRDQQVQRYRFFADKHLELLHLFREWMQFSMNLLDKELNFGVRDDRTHLPDLKDSTEESQTSRGFGKKYERESCSSKRGDKKVEETKRRDQQQQNGGGIGKTSRSEESPKSGQSADRRKDGTQQNATNSDLTVVKTGEHIAGGGLTKKMDTDGGWPPGKRRDFPTKLFRPTPIVPAAKYRHSVADGMLLRMRKDSDVWKTAVVAAKNAIGQKRQKMGEDEKQRHQLPPEGVVELGLRQFYTEKPVESAQIRQQKGRVALDHNDSFTSYGRTEPFKLPRAQNPTSQLRQPPSISKLCPQQSPAPNSERPQFNIYTVNALEQCHARDDSQDSLASSGTSRMHRHTSPLFTPADYGRLIECTTPFSAQGDHQLSLAVGERVLLAKNGTRGWILGKSIDGERSGWFPAKYVKLV